MTEVELRLTIATSAFEPAGRPNAIEPALDEAEPKLLTVPPVRATVGGGAAGVALRSFEATLGPTALIALTWSWSVVPLLTVASV